MRSARKRAGLSSPWVHSVTKVINAVSRSVSSVNCLAVRMAFVLSPAATGGLLGSSLTTDAEMTNDPESYRGYDLLAEHFPPSDDYVNELVVVRSASARVKVWVEMPFSSGWIVFFRNPFSSEAAITERMRNSKK